KSHLMQAYESSGFAKASNKMLSHIADLQAFYEQYSLMNDDTITPEQKDAKFKLLFKKHTEMTRLMGGG
ncbi:hypothetical protein, partial [Chitinimonas sp.]|uniref:hypothetical protein n=1 Tax=Chitinimonas sp. TaxID=1934313 RepID=UPI0035B459A4